MNYSDKGAVLSTCGNYRYRLWREWPDPLVQPGFFRRGGRCVFLMCNPSVADAMKDDPTIRRCVNFAQHWGYGAMEVVNLWAWRSTNPRDLAAAPDAVGPDNEQHLRAAFGEATRVVAAWGATAKVPRKLDAVQRAEHVLQLALQYSSVLVLNLTPAGKEPQHPLFVPGSMRPSVWRER